MIILNYMKNFVVETELIELIPNGNNVYVTNKFKKEYVKKIAY